MSDTKVLNSDVAVIAAVIDPDLNTSGDVSTGWVDMSVFSSIQAIVLAGDLGASATLDAKLEQATDSSGTGAKDITGKVITQMVAGTDDNTQAVINCRSAELDINSNFTHVRLTLSVATASSDSAGLILGHNARYNAADPVSTVAEVIS